MKIIVRKTIVIKININNSENMASMINERRKQKSLKNRCLKNLLKQEGRSNLTVKTRFATAAETFNK